MIGNSTKEPTFRETASAASRCRGLQELALELCSGYNEHRREPLSSFEHLLKLGGTTGACLSSLLGREIFALFSY